jgi:hypothetical protein
MTLTAAALWVLRVIAGIGGAFVGWFVSDPIARVSYRAVVLKPIPPWSLPWIKIATAAVCGLLVYYFIPLGGGPGGFGYGPGQGGGPGLGSGQGGKDTGTVTPPDGSSSKDGDKKLEGDKTKPGDKTPPGPVARKPVEIEVLGGKRYPGEQRYYLLRPTGKALTLKEVEAYFKEHGSKLELHVILTDESPADENGITADLTRLADRYRISHLEHRPPKNGP